MRIFVTGAAGLIGSGVVHHLISEGFDVTALVTKTTNITYYHPNLTWVVGDILHKEQLLRFTAHHDAIIHLAGKKSDEPNSQAVNIAGTQNIVDICSINHIQKLIYFSTVSVKLAKKGVYGTTKEKAEQIVTKSTIGAIILRPSVVYSDTVDGIMGTIVRYARYSLFPVFGNGNFTIYPLYIEDIGVCLTKILHKPFPKEVTVYEVGGAAISFNAFVKKVADTVLRQKICILHLPLFIGYTASYALKFIFKNPPITYSNVIAMDQDTKIETYSFDKTYNFSPRTLDHGLVEVRKKLLLTKTEAYEIMSYIAKRHMNPYLLQRYQTAIEYYDLKNEEFFFSPLNHTFLIGCLDAGTKIFYPDGTFQRKKIIASAIFECSPQSSRQLLPKKYSMISMFKVIIITTCTSAVKIIFGTLLISIPKIKKQYG